MQLTQSLAISLETPTYCPNSQLRKCVFINRQISPKISGIYIVLKFAELNDE